MSFELSIALRYLKGSRQTFGGGVTSAIAVGGVMVGVAALVATLAVMTGFREDIRNKILGAQPHLMVMGAQGYLPAGDWSYLFDEVPEVTAWAPFVMEQAIVKRGSVTQGVVVKGVSPEKESLVTDLHQRVIHGEWESLKAEEGEPPVFLGKELAKKLRVGLGDEVLITVPTASLGSFMNMPALFSFSVAGVLETGLYDYDSSLAVISLETAQTVFQMKKRMTGLGVRVQDPDDVIGTTFRVQRNLGSSGRVRSWLSMNRNLFSALKLEKVVMFLILTLITIVAAFTIVSNLILVTAQKVREIGILKAMGATPWSIQRIFLYKGLLMGILGTGAGVVLGLVISFMLKQYQFIQLPADVYYVETLPVKIVGTDVALVAVAAFVIVLLAALYPSRLASKLDALDAIRQL